VCVVRHAPDVIVSDMKPTAALRCATHPYDWRLMRWLRRGLGIVSAGNSGALLALAKIVIKTLRHRPAAMAAIMPSRVVMW